MSKKDEPMRAGVAELDITPPIGIDMTGFIAREGPSSGVLDPLFAKALVLDDGDTRVALITCDLLGVHWRFVREVRAAIEQATAIPAANILLTCSHTHAGPATLVLQDCGEVDAGYMAALRQSLVNVTVAACDRLQDATIGVGHGHVTTQVHNRRRPGDVIDPDLGVLKICDMEGKALAVVLNFACHPTCLQAENRNFSAEYPGIATRQVQAATGAITLFITGAIGDIGPQTRGMETMHTIGNAIGEKARRVLEQVEGMASAKLKVVVETISLPLLPPPTLEWWEREVETWQTLEVAPDVPLLPSHPRIPVAMRNWSTRFRDLAQHGALPSEVTTEVQAICLGELAFVTAPGELFVELGLAIKQQSPIQHIFICGFGNDDVGYVPTAQAYAYGGYEINEAYKYYGYPAALAPEAGKNYVALAVKLLGVEH